MTKDEIIKLGFAFEQLPSNRINIIHKNRFKLNGVLCTSAYRGCWTRTLEQKSFDDASKYIKTIEFES